MLSSDFTLFKLRFSGPLHIGDARDDYGTSLRSFSSDAMYAALTATLAKLGKVIPADGDLGCVISALFPYYQSAPEAPATLFFPRPLSLALPRLVKENAARAKSLKKVKWIDVPHLQRALAGEDILSDTSALSGIRGEFLTGDALDEKFITDEVLERVSVSRSFEDAKPFFMERIHFSGASGLFFLAEGDTRLIEEALPLLAAEGIGTDKNVGHGTFSFEKATLEITLPENATYGLSLSTFIPESKARLESLLAGNAVAYDIFRRGGWISTPPYLTLRKNAIYAFTPGSVFQNFCSGSGRIVDLAPAGLVNHPVWRCGKALVLPIKLQ